MSVDVTVTAPSPSRRETRRAFAEPAIARQAFRRIWIGAAVCAVVFGATVAASALSYVSSFPDQAARDQLALTTSADTGLAILLGPVTAVDTVGGYTVYKGFVFLSTIGAVWAILAATRLLRGEEDAGRWQLVLSGATRPARATAATLVALGAAVAVIFVGTTALTLLAGRNPDVGFGVGETVLYGLSIAVPIAVFAVVGALTSQLGRTRRVANGLAIAIFGVAFVLRMIADSGAGTRWMLWLTPFGWAELMQPFTQNDAWPLLPALATLVVLGLAATALAARRDTGDALLASNDVAVLRTRGLGSVFGLAARLEVPVLAAWCVGAAAAAFVLGVIAKLTTAAIPESISDTLDKFGVEGAFSKQYFGVAFLLVATVVAVLPAGQVGAANDEEASGRLVHVLTRPTRRLTWFASRLTLAGLAILVAGVLSGLAAWAGAQSQGVDIGFGSMLGAGLNVVPTALVALGIGALLLSVAPRIAAGAVYSVVIWSLVIDLFGSMVSGAAWMENLSLFHSMALAPAQPLDGTTITITLAVGLALCIVATLLFDRRDVST